MKIFKSMMDVFILILFGIIFTLILLGMTYIPFPYSMGLIFMFFLVLIGYSVYLVSISIHSSFLAIISYFFNEKKLSGLSTKELMYILVYAVSRLQKEYRDSNELLNIIDFMKRYYENNR